MLGAALLGCGGSQTQGSACMSEDAVKARADSPEAIAALPDLNGDGEADYAIPRGCEVLCKQEIFLSEAGCYRFAGIVNGHKVTVDSQGTKGVRNLVVMQTAPVAGAVATYQWSGVAYEEAANSRGNLSYP